VGKNIDESEVSRIAGNAKSADTLVSNYVKCNEQQARNPPQSLDAR
jgi:hypothetical protein